LKEQIKGLKTRIDILEESNRRLKLATAIKSKVALQSTNEDDTALGANKLIDELVREIDRCVALLNR
jgi:hypothetical protein